MYSVVVALGSVMQVFSSVYRPWSLEITPGWSLTSGVLARCLVDVLDSSRWEFVPSFGSGGTKGSLLESFGILLVFSLNNNVAPLLYFSNSSATRWRSLLIPILTASVPMGQSSISSVRLIPFTMNPIGGTSTKPFLCTPSRLSLRLLLPGGPSKCGVSLVR